MKISIIGGAGTVGSATAFTLAIQGLAREIVMVYGPNRSRLTSHVMDISAAAAGQDMLVRAGDFEDMAGTDAVIIAAGIHFAAAAPMQEKLAANIPIIRGIARNIERFCPAAVVVTATNPVDLLNYAIHLATSIDRRKLIGYNLNDTIRFRMAIARAMGVETSRVEGLVMGEHPRAPVPLFSSIRVDGRPFTGDENFRQRVRRELQNYLASYEALKAGRTAGWTTAAGLASLVRAIATDSGSVMSASAVLEGEYGYKSLSLGVPAVIGREGIRRIVERPLAADEQAELETVARRLQADGEIVRAILKNLPSGQIIS